MINSQPNIYPVATYNSYWLPSQTQLRLHTYLENPLQVPCTDLSHEHFMALMIPLQGYFVGNLIHSEKLKKITIASIGTGRPETHLYIVIYSEINSYI